MGDFLYGRHMMILLTTDSFDSFGKFEEEYDIVTDPHVPPAVHAPRKCPVHTQIHIKKEPETHKGLKRVTLICLLCPMLVIIHFRKYHIWNEKKR